MCGVKTATHCALLTTSRRDSRRRTLTVGGTVFTTHSPLWYHDGPGRRLLLGLSANAGAGAFGLTSSLAAAVCHLLQVSVSAATESGRGAG